jgi:hypothetical protein
VVAVVAVIALLSSGSDDTITVTLSAASSTDGTGHIYITNKGDEPWISVEMELNGTYRYQEDSIPMGEEIKLSLYEFTLEDGTRFNYMATKVLELRIKACVYYPTAGADILCPEDFAWGTTALVWN